MNVAPILLPLAIVAGLATAGCATTTPFSMLDGNLQTRVDPQLYPVRIASVDGTSYPGNPIRVEPGMRELRVVAAPQRMGVRLNTEKSLRLDVKPCTRYFLAARRETSMTADYEVFVERTAPVGGCSAG